MLSANMSVMPTKARQVLREALALSPKARADIAGTLLRSLDASEEPGVDAAVSKRRSAVAERSVRFHPEAGRDFEEGLRLPQPQLRSGRALSG
jgi:hypothetical protein